ncbi:MAG TPA: FAD-linked oxidase C-terminal domain-containing protein [Candidatus Limnocylindrales bacterium]
MTVSNLVEHVRRLVDSAWVLTDPTDRLAYDADGMTNRRVTPAIVVLPANAEEARAVIGECRDAGVPFVPRGQGTGLSGGAVPHREGVLIPMTRMGRILDSDVAAQTVVVESGVVTAVVTTAVAAAGLFYAPDPSSGSASSIGGNIAENAGGPHCLKYGSTAHHVLGLQMVLSDGTTVELGGPALDPPELDLLALAIGSEGTLGLVTTATLRVTSSPETVWLGLAAFNSIEAAGETVSAIIAAGIVPAALELLDSLAIEAAEPIAHVGLPKAAALLLVELDGPVDEVEVTRGEVERIARSNGAFELRTAATADERERLWKTRKSVAAGIGRIAKAYLTNDFVVPRSALPRMLRRIRGVADATGRTIGNVSHAGDGNMHPLVCYDPRIPGDFEAAHAVGDRIMAFCLEEGGSITGEHGVGIDKLEGLAQMFGPADLETMSLIREAFDPLGLANPGKALPTPGRCAEASLGAGMGDDGTSPEPASRSATAGRRASETASRADGPVKPVSTAELVDRLGSWSAVSPTLDETNGIAVVHVAPESPADVSSILALANEQQLAVSVVGADTIRRAREAVGARIVLSTERLTGFLDYRPDDLVIAASAGTPVGELERLVAEHDQTIALEPPFAERSTLGGAIAAGLSGPRRQKYGAPRDRLLGMRFVRAEGTLVRCGARVVKNVAGYDLSRLMAGSFGSLGVIVEATLRCSPVPPVVVSLELTPRPSDKLGVMWALACELNKARLDPSALEIGGPSTRGHVLLEGASPESAGRRAARVAELCDRFNIDCRELGPDEAAMAWAEQRDRPWAGTDTVVRVSTPLPALTGVVDELVRDASSAGLEIAWSGRLGLGVGYVGLRGHGGSASDVAKLSAVLSRTRDLARDAGGWLVVLRAGELPDEFDRWVTPPRTLALMRALKSRLDPHGILNPGMGPGGI